MPVVATDTHLAATSTTQSSSSSSLSSGAIASIVIGSLLAFVFFLALLFYLFRRYRRHSFARVPQDPSPFRWPTNLRLGAKRPPVHSKKPSVSFEPLISPVSWPPIPLTSRVHSPSTPTRSNSLSPAFHESGNELAEVNQVTTLPVTPPVLNISAPPKLEQPSSSQTLFVHRMLQSRAHASDFVAPSHQPSLDSVLSLPATVNYEDQLIGDAERTALCDEEKTEKEEEDWEQASTTESNYSQPSASLDHSSLLDRQNTVQRRKSSRRWPPTAELTPVPEVPDTPRARSDTLSLGANSSLDVQVSHGTVSRPMSMVLDENVTFPLLTSVDFGKERKESATSGTIAGSISSMAGLGSGSSGRTSRYPSLVPSSIGQPSQSGSHLDGGTDWCHLPPGLSGLKTLQIGQLRNPHSPVEEHREQTDAAPDNRAHLRQGTSSTVPEVERSVVMGSGIARIDLAF